MNVYDTDEYAAMIAAIRERPGEDMPRLVCADWLEERGEEDRAEFIRVQCEITVRRMAGQPAIWNNGDPENERYTHLKTRQWQLLLANESDWAQVAGKGMARLAWDRGFVTKVFCEYRDWSAHAKHLLRRHPVRDVRLTTLPELSLRRTGPGSDNMLLATCDGHTFEIPTLASDNERVLSWLDQRYKGSGITFTLPDGN